MNQQRQLAAILFTDIEGYTALMQEDEARAIQVRNRHRSTVEKSHQQFNGRIIQYYGDGTLSIFPSVVDGVQCALSMQQEFLQSPALKVRMGLHMGDVLFNDEHVMGDGVNIASRIESLSIPGCILISDRANEELHNHPQIQTVSVGVYQFKNVKRPVEVFALNHQALIVPANGSLKGKTESGNGGNSKDNATKQEPVKNNLQKSIAVLPFVNMSNDPDQEYFSDGMAEEIINALTHIKDLKVAGRTSSFQFKGKSIDLRDIGEKLGVNTVLEGSIRKQGNLIRVTAQLINVQDGYHLWSEKYDRQMDDVFAIQDDISNAITHKLKLTLFRKDKSAASRRTTKHTEAYELYLKGRFYLERRGASILTAIEFFRKAIALDADFAPAHAGYADAYILIATYGLLPSKQILLQAKQSAEKALQLDSSLCEAWCTLGYYYNSYEWNWTEAKRCFKKAIEVNPHYAEGHLRYGWNYLTCVEGKFEEAEKHGEIAIALEPLSSIIHANYSFILHCAGKFEKALAICKKGIELDKNSFLCHLNAATSLMAMGQYEEALHSFEWARKLSNRHFFTTHPYIWIFCLTGKLDRARTLMAELKVKSKTEYVAKTLTGLSSAYLQNLDEAFDYMDKACDDRDPILLMLKHEPWVPQNLRQDPRFSTLLGRIGFPGND